MQDDPHADQRGDAREVVEFEPRHCGDFERRGRAERTRARSCRGFGFQVSVGRVGLGGAHRHQHRLGGSGIDGVPARSRKATSRVKLFVGAGSASTKAVPHRQDSWDHGASSHPHQPEVNGRHSGSAGLCRRLARLGDVTRRKFCPEQLYWHSHSGSQEDHPSHRKLRVIDDLSHNGHGVLLLFRRRLDVCGHATTVNTTRSF